MALLAVLAVVVSVSAVLLHLVQNRLAGEVAALTEATAQVRSVAPLVSEARRSVGATADHAASVRAAMDRAAASAHHGSEEEAWRS